MRSCIYPQQLGRLVGVCLALFSQARFKSQRLAFLLLLPLTTILAAPLSAQAATVLFLTTAETNSTATTEIANAKTAFSAQASANSLTFIDGTGALSNPSTPLNFTDVKLVVVLTVYNTIDPSRMSELLNALTTNPNLAIVAFMESCVGTGNCASTPQNLEQLMVNGIQVIQPDGWSIDLGSATTANYNAPLNTASLYASTFSDAGLNPLSAGRYTPIINVPLNYALYTQRALPSPLPATVDNNVVGLFIPQAASNGGQGACLFLTADASEFSATHTTQYPLIAKAFTTAALDPNGACAQPVAGVPDLWVTLSEPEGPVIGQPSAMTLTVSNTDPPGVVASTDGQVEVTLPSGLALSGSPPTGCTATATGFTCPLSLLEPSASVPFNFEVIATATLANAPVSAKITGVTNEVNLSNNTATLNISTVNNTPDLAVTLSAVETELSPGGSSSVTLAVSNSDQPDVAASIDGQLVVTLPSDLQLSSPLPTGCSATPTGFICPLSVINPGETLSALHFQITAPAPILTESLITAEIRDVTGEVNLANNSATLSISAPPPPVPDLAVALSAVVTRLSTGVPSRVTLTVSNSGLPGVIPSTNGQVEVTLPSDLELSGNPPAGCNATASGFICPSLTLDPGQSLRFRFQVVAQAPILIASLITAEITAVVPTEANLANNQATLPFFAQSSASSSTTQPVPALATPALVLLALLTVGTAAAVTRRCKR